MNHKPPTTLYLWLSISLYVLSLLLPAAIIPDFERGVPETHIGWEILTMGWAGLLALQPAWLANIFYMMGLITYGSKYCKIFMFIALVLALCSPLVLVSHLLIGFYFWIGSFILLMYGNNLHPQSVEKINRV
ncbi:MAG: hypothetical protein EPN84_03805 [Legionella sp.]|nr:MAG: hypothetical protein EPN84_03805 [Legionella sp.]